MIYGVMEDEDLLLDDVFTGGVIMVDDDVLVLAGLVIVWLSGMLKT